MFSWLVKTSEIRLKFKVIIENRFCFAAKYCKVLECFYESQQLFKICFQNKLKMITVSAWRHKELRKGSKGFRKFRSDRRRSPKFRQTFRTSGWSPTGNTSPADPTFPCKFFSSVGNSGILFGWLELLYSNCVCLFEIIFYQIELAPTYWLLKVIFNFVSSVLHNTL